jgi:hypothetical protein
MLEFYRRESSPVCDNKLKVTQSPTSAKIAALILVICQSGQIEENRTAIGAA